MESSKARQQTAPTPGGAASQLPQTAEGFASPELAASIQDEAADVGANGPDTAASPAVTWTAAEFIAHAKPSGWYAALTLGAAVFAVLVFLVSRDITSVGVVIIAAVLFGIYAGHQPKEVEYRLDGSGVTIGRKRFGYNEFRSFSVIQESPLSSIVFMPLKRFAVQATIYYDPAIEDQIVNFLSGRLPVENRGHDAVDRLMQRIRF